VPWVAAKVVLAKSLLQREKLGTLVGTERLSLDWAEAVAVLDHAMITRSDPTIIQALEEDLVQKTRAVRHLSCIHCMFLGT
jgi:hypothetical protein